jgi:integrase
MRHSEILAARFDQIDFTHCRLEIPKAKSGARIQPMTAGVCQMLEKERAMRDDPDGWIFPARPGGQGGHRARMRKAFRRAVIRAGLDPAQITPHALRHSAITALVQAGADIPTIMKISGHRSVTMVLRYVHIHDRHIDQAMAALDRPHDYPGITQTAEPVPEASRREIK